jgi:hypothetical protein
MGSRGAVEPAPNDLKGILVVTGPLFDGLYAFKQRAHMLGRDPA